jgi:hypothetical protein
MSLPIFIIDNRTASMWLKTSDRNDSFAQFGSPDPEPTILVFVTNRELLFV